MHYPIMLDLTDKKITIIGGGKVAYRKLTHFLDFKGSVTVISETFIADFEQAKGKVSMIRDTYKEVYLKDSFVVVAATNNKTLNNEIGAYCKAKNILCNIASNQELSSFIMPSFIKRGELVISVSTGGNSPTLASKIKKELEDQYDTSYEGYVALLGQIREHVLHQSLSEAEKASILNSLLDMNREQLNVYLKELENMK